jgi:hypothetical protein
MNRCIVNNVEIHSAADDAANHWHNYLLVNYEHRRTKSFTELCAYFG